MCTDEQMKQNSLVLFTGEKMEDVGSNLANLHSFILLQRAESAQASVECHDVQNQRPILHLTSNLRPVLH
jgi:hypothetical protein